MEIDRPFARLSPALLRLRRVVGRLVSWCLRDPQRKRLLFLAVFSPAVLTGYWIAENAVNIPTWDGWERGVLLQKAHDGTLDFEYLSSAHIDHRPLIPRLLTLAAAALSGGDVRVEIWLGYLAVVAGGIGLFFVLWKSFGRGAWLWWTALLVNLVLFSPLQYQNFLWAVQLAFLLPLGCLGLLVAVMRSGWRLPVKFVVCVLLAEVATFSFGHGLVLWPVAVCLALMMRGFAPARPRLIFVGLMLLVAGLTIWTYFNWNYINTSQPKHAYGTLPGEPPPSIDRLENLHENFRKVKYYFWSTLGSSLARCFHSDPAQASTNVGRGLVWVFAGCVLWMLARWRNEDDWRALLPWAALGMFSVVVAAMLASGRGATSPFDRSIMPRYISQTMFLCIALVVMLAYMLWRYRNRAAAQNPKLAVALTNLAVALAAGFAVLQSQLWVYGIHKMEAWKLARLEERFELLYVKHFEPRYPDRIDGDIDDAKDGEVPFSLRQAHFLSEIGHLQPAMFEEKDFGTFEKLAERAHLKRADLIRLIAIADDRLAVRGFATLQRGRIGDGILVSWRLAEGTPIPRKLADAQTERRVAKRIARADWQLLDIAEIHAGPAMRASFYDGQFGETQGNLARVKNFARFDKQIDISPLPENEMIDLVFWVADTERMEVRPFKQAFRFKRSKLEPGEVLFEAK